MLSFKKYTTSADGNVAMMFAVTTLMILTAIGAAVDYTNLTRAQAALQAQIDAGVLAAATVDVERRKNGTYKKEQKTRKEAAFEVIEANGYNLKGNKPILTIGERSVILQAELDYKPAFGGILGIDKIKLTASAESGLPGKEGVDIVLVLDNTRSMEVEGKMDALEDGAVKLVEAIESSNSATKVALVPFARYVRVNDSARTESWFQMPTEYDTPRTGQSSSTTGQTCTPRTYTANVDGVQVERETQDCTGGTTTYEDRSWTVKSRWDGCVGTRATPFAEKDGSYTNRIPGLLNKETREQTGLGWDVNAWCPAEIVPLTDDYENLKTKIRGMWTTDNTHIPTGLIWGQRVLSPGAPYDNSPEDGGLENRKVMVLMSDGNNTTEIMEDSDAQNNWTSPPYIGDVPDDETAINANASTARLCENLKSEGIEIYTIAFKVKDNQTKKLLRKCATRNKQAMTAESNDALIEQFESIATSLEADIRLMR